MAMKEVVLKPRMISPEPEKTESKENKLKRINKVAERLRVEFNRELSSAERKALFEGKKKCIPELKGEDY